METEINESPWNFPCEFPIKIVGKTGPEFETFVLTTIRKHVPDLKEDALTIRPSSDGKYTALTVTIMAQSKEQLDTIYSELTQSEWVIMAL